VEVTFGTLFGQGLTFLVFILVTMKFVWPPLTQAMEERRKRIADGLAAGEQAQHDLDEAKVEAEQIIKEARDTAGEIREQATNQAAQIKDQAKADAHAERERQVTAAQAEIEQNANRAREELAGKVATLAVAGAEKLLEREVDADAHRDLLDKLAAEI
jgi:F-type H+-transporting ATPase subunit b